MDIAILAGGCFWCTEAVFQRVKGVEEVSLVSAVDILKTQLIEKS